MRLTTTRYWRTASLWAATFVAIGVERILWG